MTVNAMKETAVRGMAGRRALLVTLARRDPLDTEMAAGELASLAATLRLNVAETVRARINDPHPATYLGRGRVEELAALRAEKGIALAVFQEDLTPVQQRNLEKALGADVMDRTGLILQIFSEHARSHEGKIQVELAQLQYLMPRLAGRGVLLSRLGGGLGTRGPGEMKIEVERRRIRERIHALTLKIGEMEKHRRVIREGRRKKSLPTAALVGYTNAGKTTILNRLSARRDLRAADQLFSTLDPATRAVWLGGGLRCLMTDTVGLLHNLPHHLIAAFKATLEEAVFSDVLVLTYDVSSRFVDRQIGTTFEVVRMLGMEDKPYIEVLNKADLLTAEERAVVRSRFPGAVPVSAATGEGFDELRERITEAIHDCAVA